MNFATPGAVSSGSNNDNIKMKVVEQSLFKSTNFKPLDPASFKDGDGTISKSVPPIIADEEAAANIEDSTETGGDVMNFMSSGNFILSLILGGSM